MRFGWIPLGVAVLAAGMSLVAVAASCSDGGERPPPTTGGGSSSGFDGSSGSSGSSGEGGLDANSEAAPLPVTCSNTVRDGAETDVDCGGNACLKCIDGKDCVNNNDCAGGSCVNNKCTTAACSDGVRNGDESDVDCGGTTCAKCTIGKRCGDGKDCVSKACTGMSCACPQGMTTVSRQGGGGAYCIDEIEVTKFQYNKFLTANVSVSDQIAVCKAPVNGSFVPRGAWPPSTTPPALPTPGAGLAYNYSLPVHYVDWCDAYAYCRWASKQLCGKVTGGSVDPSLANHADAGAWYNACSAQGAKPWGYSTIFEADRCNGFDNTYPGRDAGPSIIGGKGFGYGGANQDEGIYVVNNGDLMGNYTLIEHAECFAGVTGLYHMSGNVAEWEDSCDGQLPTSQCRVRGGSYKAAGSSTTLSCAGVRTEERMPAAADPDPLKDVGFRCCLY